MLSLKKEEPLRKKSLEKSIQISESPKYELNGGFKRLERMRLGQMFITVSNEGKQSDAVSWWWCLCV